MAREGFPGDRTRCGLRNHHQLPGAAGGVVVVAWKVGLGHREISGSTTGLTSRRSAEMCPLPQVPSASASRTAANIRFCQKLCVFPATHNDASSRISWNGQLDFRRIWIRTFRSKLVRDVISAPCRIGSRCSRRPVIPAQTFWAQPSAVAHARRGDWAPCMGQVGIELQLLSGRRRGDDRRQRRAARVAAPRPAGCRDLADLRRPAHHGAMIRG